MVTATIAWSLFGLYNVAISTYTASADFGALPQLPSYSSWFQYALTTELALSVLGLFLGLLQFVVAYGFLKGRAWSVWLGLGVAVLISIEAAAFAYLYQTAPSSSGLASPANAGAIIWDLIVLGGLWRFLRRPDIRQYLNN